ncbi:Bcr/CflA family efflux MFS transporter [Rhodopseudomonas boonkerdii]|uniref:multidrug effflux MFS transporter n=1 Tax=Rhodopseudomonas boonkerdii TaxID=475937 RepID=UPI001E4209B5|nr:Bcr/CflA family efflux MFS transporter [Rhodopseudomonas boonkerdii]UGV25500.1 Bcr/CflA family efflux MFS transporter [Rhodopseudomonas boonkerdii]
MSSFARNAIVLGLLCAVGPFAIDMYLPALPDIESDLGATTSATQLTLTSYFIAFGLCQIAYGPLSDVYGRKAPLYAGLALFVAGSVGCAWAPTVEWLIAFRFVQGLGAAAMGVIPRAIIRDLHTGVEATRLMSLVMLVFSVSPILAPLGGSALIVPFGWRAVFVAVTVAALIATVLLATMLPETRPVHERIRGDVRSVLGHFGVLFRDWHFLGLTFIGGFGMSSFFTFLSMSSFVYIKTYGLTLAEYSVAFSINAVGFIGVSQLAGRLGARFGMGRVVMGAVAAYAFFAMLLLALTLAGFTSLWVLIPLLFTSFAFLGLVIPSTMVLSLEEHGPIAGSASALGGTLQMLTGGVVIAVAGLFFNGTSLPMVATVALTAMAALAITMVTLRPRELSPQLAE